MVMSLIVLLSDLDILLMFAIEFFMLSAAPSKSFANLTSLNVCPLVSSKGRCSTFGLVDVGLNLTLSGACTLS